MKGRRPEPVRINQESKSLTDLDSHLYPGLFHVTGKGLADPRLQKQKVDQTHSEKKSESVDRA